MVDLMTKSLDNLVRKTRDVRDRVDKIVESKYRDLNDELGKVRITGEMRQLLEKHRNSTKSKPNQLILCRDGNIRGEKLTLKRSPDGTWRPGNINGCTTMYDASGINGCEDDILESIDMLKDWKRSNHKQRWLLK